MLHRQPTHCSSRSRSCRVATFQLLVSHCSTTAAWLPWLGVLHRQPSYRSCRSCLAAVVAAASLLQLSYSSTSLVVFALQAQPPLRGRGVGGGWWYGWGGYGG